VGYVEAVKKFPGGTFKKISQSRKEITRKAILLYFFTSLHAKRHCMEKHCSVFLGFTQRRRGAKTQRMLRPNFDSYP
jgi:hypothetical protein